MGSKRIPSRRQQITYTPDSDDDQDGNQGGAPYSTPPPDNGYQRKLVEYNPYNAHPQQYNTPPQQYNAPPQQTPLQLQYNVPPPQAPPQQQTPQLQYSAPPPQPLAQLQYNVPPQQTQQYTANAPHKKKQGQRGDENTQPQKTVNQEKLDVRPPDKKSYSKKEIAILKQEAKKNPIHAAGYDYTDNPGCQIVKTTSYEFYKRISEVYWPADSQENRDQIAETLFRNHIDGLKLLGLIADSDPQKATWRVGDVYRTFSSTEPPARKAEICNGIDIEPLDQPVKKFLRVVFQNTVESQLDPDRVAQILAAKAWGINPPARNAVVSFDDYGADIMYQLFEIRNQQTYWDNLADMVEAIRFRTFIKDATKNPSTYLKDLWESSYWKKQIESQTTTYMKDMLKKESGLRIIGGLAMEELGVAFPGLYLIPNIDYKVYAPLLRNKAYIPYIKTLLYAECQVNNGKPKNNEMNSWRVLMENYATGIRESVKKWIDEFELQLRGKKLVGMDSDAHTALDELMKRWTTPPKEVTNSQEATTKNAEKKSGMFIMLCSTNIKYAVTYLFLFIC